MRGYSINRRRFLKSTGLVSVAFSMSPGLACGELPPTYLSPDSDVVDSWLKVLDDGRIQVITGKLELGQGIKTAILQVAAEELSMSMDRMEIIIADTDKTPNEGYTAGSRSIESSAMSVRMAAATAREIVFEMARKKFNSDAYTTINQGVITCGMNRISLSDLLEGRYFKSGIRKNVPLYSKTQRKITGTSVKRRDIEDMVHGRPVYVHDLRFEGMVHARMVRPNSYGASLVEANENEISQMPGFIKAIKKENFFAVISSEEYQAIKICEKASRLATWKGGMELPTGKSLPEYLKTLKTDSNIDHSEGDWENELQGSAVLHEAEFFKPYIMHASNGPSCAVAHYANNELTIWTHSQGVYPLRASISSWLSMPEERIHVKGVPGSGCYGHNGADDVAAEAAFIALQYPDKHVRLQWMREEENCFEPYGTAMLMKLQAGLDANGLITGWKYDLWSDSHSTRPGGRASNLLPGQATGSPPPEGGFRGGATRNAVPYYALANIEVFSHIFKGPLRISALRGLGAYANIFAIECFMDELAEKAKKHPLDFRVAHLEDSRAKDCLTQLKKMTAKTSLEEGEGIGFAFSRYKNSASYCGIAASVGVDPVTGSVALKKMWSVTDSGEVINPDGLKNQIEGGMIQSASWALMENVEFDKNQVISRDWYSYPILRFDNIPEVEVHLIDRPDQPPLGAGEAAQGPATAAVINAIYAASGVRIRNLPVDVSLLRS